MSMCVNDRKYIKEKFIADLRKFRDSGKTTEPEEMTKVDSEQFFIPALFHCLNLAWSQCCINRDILRSIGMVKFWPSMELKLRKKFAQLISPTWIPDLSSKFTLARIPFSALTLFRKDSLAAKKLGVGFLVMTIWLELGTTYGSSSHYHFHHPWLR